MKKMQYLFSSGAKKSGLVCRVVGPSVNEVNHVVFTDRTGRKDSGTSEKYNLFNTCTHLYKNLFHDRGFKFKKSSLDLKIPVHFEIVYVLSAALFI